MKIVLTLCLQLLIMHGLLAQDITLVHQSNQSLSKLKATDDFHFFEPNLDTALITYVATLKATMEKDPSVEAMYDRIEGTARKMGGNGFMLKQFNDTLLLVNIYFADEKALAKNNELKPKNTFYIFAGEKSEAKEYYAFELNGASKTIKNGTYIEYKLKEGEQVKLKKGTVTGTTMWVKWKPDQLPSYYSIHGFYKEPIVKRTTMSSSTRPSKFSPVNSALGALLVHVLTLKED